MRVLLGNIRVVVENARKGRDRYVSFNIVMFSLVEVFIFVLFHVAKVGCHENSDPENSDLRPRKLRPLKFKLFSILIT